VLHTKPNPTGPQAATPYIMGSPILWPCSFAPPGLCYPELPPLRTTVFLWDHPLRPRIHRHLQYPPGHAPRRPAWPCTISAGPPPKTCTSCRNSVLLGHAPQPCTISALLATPPRPAQPCTIFTLQACAPKACQARDTHTHMISVLPHHVP
jgi:hypothetical protein